MIVTSLDPLYIQGYTTALYDVKKNFENINYNIDNNKQKKISKKYIKILKDMIKEITDSYNAYNTINKYNENTLDDLEKRINNLMKIYKEE